MVARRRAQAANSKGQRLMVSARGRHQVASWLLALSIFCFLQGGRAGEDSIYDSPRQTAVSEEW
jgi:hypothetical protein